MLDLLGVTNLPGDMAREITQWISSPKDMDAYLDSSAAHNETRALWRRLTNRNVQDFESWRLPMHDREVAFPIEFRLAVPILPESIEFVQLDLYGKRELSKTDMSAIDIQSSDALTKTVVMRRQHGFTETSWPYRMSTGCQMSLVQVSDSKPMDSQFDTQIVAAFQLLGVK